MLSCVSVFAGGVCMYVSELSNNTFLLFLLNLLIFKFWLHLNQEVIL